MKDKKQIILECLDSLNISKWGAADISGLHPLSVEYPKAISLITAYSALEGYDEEKYHLMQSSCRDRLDEAVSSLEVLLKELEIKHLAVPHGQTAGLLGTFPHKLAAVRGGLGRIGKNSLLITQEYGPRIHMATVLLDYELDCGKPITDSLCGDCDECAKACPYECIKNVEWHPGMDRAELLDVFLCSSKREEFIDKIGHKHSCGLCLFACPMGSSRPQR